jgi:hypothetical protein
VPNGAVEKWFQRWDSNPQGPGPKSGGFTSSPTLEYWFGEQASNLRPLGSEPSAPPAKLSPNNGGGFPRLRTSRHPTPLFQSRPGYSRMEGKEPVSRVGFEPTLEPSFELGASTVGLPRQNWRMVEGSNLGSLAAGFRVAGGPIASLATIHSGGAPRIRTLYLSVSTVFETVCQPFQRDAP